MKIKKINNSNKNMIFLAIGMSFIILIMLAMTINRFSEAKNINNEMKNTLSQQKEYGDLHAAIYRNLVDRSTAMFELSKNDSIYQETIKQDLDNKLDELKGFQKQCMHLHLTEKPNLFSYQRQSLAEFNELQSRYISMSDTATSDELNRYFVTNILPKRSAVLGVIQEGINEISTTINEINQSLIKENERQIGLTFILNLMITFVCAGFFLFLLLKQSSFTKKLDHKAKTDPLTSLTNRTQFLQEATEYLDKNPDSTFTVSFLDIDYAKNINDTYGHEAGDQLIKLFAEKIQSVTFESCILARFGGDEFVLMIKSSDEKESRKIIEKLSNTLDTDFYIQNNEISITASIGIARYPKDGDSIIKLLKCADDAMYNAKRAGRNTYRFYSSAMRDLDIKNNHTIQKLRTILNHDNSCGSLYMEYQPLLNCFGGVAEDVSECEALLRWKDSDGTIISPDEFIPLSEKSNLIETINCFVIDEVCRQQKAWKDSGDATKMRTNINLSGKKDPFIKQLLRLRNNIKEFGLDPRLFGIELTERTLFDISESTIHELNLIRNLGIKASIDDFGTGYSSLCYLNKLPLTTLKIDKSFVDDLPDNVYSRTIVKSTIALAHSLGMDVVAEGVETKKQHDYLLAQSCNYIQGYFYQKPMGNTEISSLLKSS